MDAVFASGFGLFIIGCPLVFVALIVFLIVRAQRLARERREGMAGLAAAREWGYAPQDQSLVTRFAGRPFGVGSSRRAMNAVYGYHDGRGFVAFDYHYTTSSGESSTSHQVGVVAVSTGVQMPELQVVPQGAIRRFFDKLTNSDIHVGNQAFDEMFRVTSPSPQFARDVLSPQLVETMLTLPSLAFRLSGDSLLLITHGLQPMQLIDGKLLSGDLILDRIPERVWRNLREN